MIGNNDLVLDVSLSCAWCFADQASPAAWAVLERLHNAVAHVPALWLWETGNVLIQAERRGRINAAAIRTFLGLLETLPISTDHATTASAWHDTLALARSHGLTTYNGLGSVIATARGHQHRRQPHRSEALELLHRAARRRALLWRLAGAAQRAAVAQARPWANATALEPGFADPCRLRLEHPGGPRWP